MRYRWCVLATLAACSSSGGGPAPEPPDSCSPGRLSYVDNIRIGDRALGAGDHSIQAYTFTPGDHPTLDLDDGGDEGVFIEGEEPLVAGDSVAARGYVKFQRTIGDDNVPYDFGNCETGAFSGTLTLSLDGTMFQFTIEDMHKPPYCSGDSIRGGFAGCYKKPTTP